MRNRYRSLLGGSLLLAGSVVQANLVADPALGAPDPAKEWYTLQTAHFNIHYEHTQTAFAERLAKIAERVHTTLTPNAGWVPLDKTEIVINDSVDASNGGATVLPYNQFFIFMTPPTGGELLDDADWVELVFTHEYMHVLHLDQARGFPNGVRKVLGRWIFAFPQVFNPSWITEGYAVWAETQNERGIGRGQSALYDGMMRAEVMKGPLDLTRLSYHGYSGTDWPYGQSYLYGVYFFQFIEATWGAEKIKSFIADWNGNFVPWRMDSRARHVFGISAEDLHGRYLDYLNKRFQPQIDDWKARHPQQDTPLLAGNGHRGQVQFDGQGGVYYHESDGRHASALMHRSAAGHVENVAETKALQQFDVHPSAGVIMSGLQVCDNTELHADLFRLEGRRWKAITDCGRYVSGYWSPRGDHIAAVGLDSGRQKLVLLDAKGRRIETLYQAPLGETLGALAWHPQGESLVIARKPQGERWGLYTFVLATRQWQAVAGVSGVVYSPRYDENGENIYFIDDNGNRRNVRRLTVASGEVVTITDTLTAVTDFDIHNDSLASLEYSAEGIALNIKPLQTQFPESTPPVASEKLIPPPFDPLDDQAMPWNVPPAPYDPLDTMAPTAWLALLGADSEDNGWLQILAAGGDVLGFHAWQLAPRIYYDQQTLGGDLAYLLHKRIAVLGSRLVETVDLPNDDTHAIVDVEDRVQLLWTQPFNNLDTSLQLNMGVAEERINRQQDDQSLGDTYQANLAGVSLMVDSTDYYRYSVSLEEGRQIKLTAEKYNALGGGDFRGDTYALDWQEYISTWQNQVLALRGVEARADDEARELELGGAHDAFETIASQIGFGKTRYSLRGYETGLEALTGENLSLQSLEYRLPVANVFDGALAPPIGLGKVSMAVFYERGAAWDDNESRKYYASAGLELSPQVLVGFNLLPLNFTLGYAKGLDDDWGSDEFYLRLEANF